MIWIWSWVWICFQATDPDAGLNGQVRYRLLSHASLFSINSTGTIVTAVPLDRETRSRYDLIVEASDGAVDPRRTTVTLLVEVTDINDNSPVFSQATYMVSVPENTPAGTVILRLGVSLTVDIVLFVYQTFSFLLNSAFNILCCRNPTAAGFCLTCASNLSCACICGCVSVFCPDRNWLLMCFCFLLRVWGGRRRVERLQFFSLFPTGLHI